MMRKNVTQDLGVPASEIEASIFSSPTPESCTYPPGITIKWREIEALLTDASKQAAEAAHAAPRGTYWAYCHVLSGNFDFYVPSEDLKFEIIGVREGNGIPVRLGERTILYSSEGNAAWEELSRAVKLFDTTKLWRDAPSWFQDAPGYQGIYSWPCFAEDQYFICALRALHRVRNLGLFPLAASKEALAGTPLAQKNPSAQPVNFFAGFDGDTAEMWINRSIELSRLDPSMQ